MPEIFKNKSECTACSACVNICPRGALSFQEDEYGFKYPVINSSCINCNACVNVHERRKALSLNEPVKAYAAKTNKNIESASGGIAALLSRKIVEEGGVVYGAAFGYDFEVSHRRCDSPSSITALAGSKYVQSDLKDTFLNVKKDLAAGKTVLFTGTPCQVEGLYAYLDKKPPRLITLDIVCHGVPSGKMWQDYVETLEKSGEISNLTFRDKSLGWGINGSVTYKNGRKVVLWGSKEPYLHYFLNGSIYRPNCYECRFAGENRPADITLGDYWGIEKEIPKFNIEGGVSAVIANTKKGQRLIESVLEECEYAVSSFDSISKGNTQLRKPSVNSEPEILEVYKSEGWPGVEKAFAKVGFFKKNSSFIKSLVPKGIKKRLKGLK